jgi:hypothetical protein
MTVSICTGVWPSCSDLCLPRFYGAIMRRTNIEYANGKVSAEFVAHVERIVAEAVEWQSKEELERQQNPTEEEIRAALDFGRTIDQHIGAPPSTDTAEAFAPPF